MTDIITDREQEQLRARIPEDHATGYPLSTRRETLSIALGAFLLTLAVRLPTLGRQSLWIDEVFTSDAIALSWPGLIAERLSNGHFPTYFLLLKGVGLSGSSEMLLRLPSALFESAAAAIFAVIAHQLGGRIAAVVTAILFAFLPILVFYGQEARPYAMMLFSLAIMMTGQRTLLIGSTVEPQSTRLGAAGWTATLGAIAAALTIPAAMVSIASSHAGLVLAGALRSGANNRRRVLRHLLATWLVIGIASLVLIPSVITEATSPEGLLKWQVADSASFRLTNVWYELFGLMVARDVNIYLPAGWERYPSLGLILLAVAGAWIGRRQPSIRYLSGMVLVTLIAFLALGSFTATVARYLLGVIPPFLILVGYTASRLLVRPSWLRPIWLALVIAIVAMTALQGLDAVQSNARYNWRDLSRFLRTSAIGNAAVLTNAYQSGELFQHYQPDTASPAFETVPMPELWKRVPTTGTAYVLAFYTGESVPDGVAAGRTICRWTIDEATFFALTSDPTKLPAPLQSCASQPAGG